MRRILDFAVGVGVTLGGTYYWNTTHWSIKACEDVTHLERYMTMNLAARRQRRAVASYPLLVMRQFDCGEDTEVKRREAMKIISGQ